MLQSLCDRDTERGDLITSDFTWLNPKVTSYLPKVVMATCVVVKIEDQKFFWGVDNRVLLLAVVYDTLFYCIHNYSLKSLDFLPRSNKMQIGSIPGVKPRSFTLAR